MSTATLLKLPTTSTSTTSASTSQGPASTWSIKSGQPKTHEHSLSEY